MSQSVSQCKIYIYLEYHFMSILYMNICKWFLTGAQKRFKCTLVLRFQLRQLMGSSELGQTCSVTPCSKKKARSTQFYFIVAILDLPNEILSTPLGQMLAPMIQQMTPSGQGR